MLSVESRTKSHLLSKKKEEATLHTASLGTKSEAAAGGLSRHRELWNNVERQARAKLPNPACLTQPEVTTCKVGSTFSLLAVCHCLVHVNEKMYHIPTTCTL